MSRAALLSLVNRVIAPLGVVLRSRNRPTREMTEFLARVAAGPVGFGTVIDVGVGFGTSGLYRSFPGARILLVEPMQEFHASLEELAKTFEGTVIEPVAAGAEAGEIELHVFPGLTSTSAFPSRNVTPREVRRVQRARLDDLVAKHDLPGPYSLKIDVQGFEVEVLKGAGNTLDNSDIVIAEASLFAFQTGQVEMAELIAFMATRGFAVYDILNGHFRPLDGALAQVDLVFAKAGGPFRSDHRYTSDEQAAAVSARIAREERRLKF